MGTNGNLTANRTLTIPDKTGTIALTSDIPTVPTNVSAFTNDAGYLTSYTETDPVFSASAAHGISASDITNWNGKQAALVSGTNIKTINNESILGSGNISISASGGVTGAKGSGAISISPPVEPGSSYAVGNLTISHSTSAGYKHIPSGGSSGQVLGYGGSSGTASWVTPSSGGTQVQIVRW